MKKLLIILTLLSSTHAFCQDFKAEVGFAAGASNKAGLINWMSGAAYKDNHHLFLDFGIHLTSIASTPDFLGLKYGYLITRNKATPQGLEVFVGMAYNMLSSATFNDKNRGWRAGYGAMWKTKRWYLKSGVEDVKSFARTYDFYYIVLGIYAVK